MLVNLSFAHLIMFILPAIVPSGCSRVFFVVKISAKFLQADDFLRPPGKLMFPSFWAAKVYCNLLCKKQRGVQRVKQQRAVGAASDAPTNTFG